MAFSKSKVVILNERSLRVKDIGQAGNETLRRLSFAGIGASKLKDLRPANVDRRFRVTFTDFEKALIVYRAVWV